MGTERVDGHGGAVGQREDVRRDADRDGAAAPLEKGIGEDREAGGEPGADVENAGAGMRAVGGVGGVVRVGGDAGAGTWVGGNFGGVVRVGGDAGAGTWVGGNLGGVVRVDGDAGAGTWVGGNFGGVVRVGGDAGAGT
ncbi:hypothetical protein [Streptomyces sp. NPDC088925]|uniref:hypothetical protein n=1 Tax=Streptomyces sp. NPDC088925 TaxID=3365914 RepID=UPI0037FCE60D